MPEKNWIDRYLERTPEEHAALRAAAERRYAHLVNKPREWLADPTFGKNETDDTRRT
jgi:hypothetical protein